MAAKRIPALTVLTGAQSATDDKIVIFDATADTTKAITRVELGKGIVGDLPYTPSGGIAATTIPAAIAELDTEKVAFTRLDDSDGSSLVGFLQSGTSAVTRTAQNKLRDTVSFKDFGAVGDGVTNDATTVTAALNSGAKVVDGQNLTYKLSANIAPTSENIVVQNATFDISDITTGGSAIEFTGTQAAGVALTSDILAGTNAIAVGSTTGFAADDYAFVASSTLFWTAGSATLGQIVKIKSVDSGTAMTLYDDVLYDFTTAASATIAKLTMKQNITFRNVKFIGAGTGIQTALDFNKCADVVVDNCETEYVDYVSFLFDRCVNSTVTNTAMRYARSVGLSYGIAIANGSYSTKIANCYGEDQRHMITTGDNEGVNLFITITNCHAASQRDAGIDGHPACDFMVVDGNTIECVDSAADGIIFQGLNCVITNNIIAGNVVTGIRHQLLPDAGVGSSIISNNRIRTAGGTIKTDTAIYVDHTSAATTNGVTISNNIISSATDFGILVYARLGNINGVTITGNTMTNPVVSTACQLRAAAGFAITDFAITGNIFKTSGVQNVYLLGSTAPNILNGTISGNSIIGGTNGIRMIQTQNVVETGNYNTGVTRKVFVDTGSSNVWLDRRQSSIITTAASTYTVADQDQYIIANVGGTLTLTLPVASAWSGREITIKTVEAQTVVSASSNVIPIDSLSAGTAILPATDGAWSLLKSNGTNWVVMARGS